MSSLTPLIDTLLATRLAQRVDLVPLRPEVQLTGPGPVTQVEEVSNDVRLPSRTGVEQQLGVGPLKSGLRGHGDMAAKPHQAVILSTAARTVSAILDGQTDAAARIIGSSPLLASSQLPPPLVIAAILARTVGHSGLFYESHLAQFAAGARSLAELAQEPQARLEASPKTVPGLPAGSCPDGDQAMSAEPDSVRHAPGVEATQAHKNAYAAMQKTDGSIPAAKIYDDSATHAARSNAPALAGIHQDAVALVRQQLELLAQSAFRWSGEVWPEVPIDWEIREDKHQVATGDEAVLRSWSTRLTLTLPTLRDIEVRFSLTGHALQVRLAAREDTTLEQLREARTELSERLDALGLELTGLQISALAADAEASLPKVEASA